MSDSVLRKVAVQFTFIRHGESIDNLRSVWAGLKDSELSVHGKNQAEALVKSFSVKRLTAIHSSPLRRTLATAEAVKNSQRTDIPLHSSSLLQEQHFGRGEGQSYAVQREKGLSLAAHISQGKFPEILSRTERFPDGESLEDVARRADQAVEELILPHVRIAANEHTNDMHVAFVSHGIFITEIVASLLRRCGSKADARSYRGLRNTGWTLVVVTAKVEDVGDLDLALTSARVVEHNSCDHLKGLVGQKGGIGSSAYDPKQKDIRSFFSIPKPN